MNLTRTLPLLAILAALSGCYVATETVYVEPVGSGGGAYGGAPSTLERSIDSDAMLGDIAPGLETGLYVEYRSGGLWRLYTTCGDVATYGSCHWDVVTTVHGGTFVGAAPDQLDAEDLLSSDDQGAWIDAYTGHDLDGMYVQTTPGSSLEVDALLDGVPAHEYLFWVSDGAAIYGAPSNPIELVPTAP